MPQLNPDSFLTQIVWLVITFAVLYLVMWRVALPRVTEVLRDRQGRIDSDLEKAETLKREAEDVLAAYEKTVAEGRAEAQSILREAADRIAADSERQHAEVSARLARETDEATDRIARAKADAMAHVREAAADAAQAVAEKLTGASVTPDEAATAAQSAMEERR